MPVIRMPDERFADWADFPFEPHEFFRRRIPSAKAQPGIVIQGAGSFLQQEEGEEIAQYILQFIERTSSE